MSVDWSDVWYWSESGREWRPGRILGEMWGRYVIESYVQPGAYFEVPVAYLRRGDKPTEPPQSLPKDERLRRLT